jgi:hypothetical protein
MGVKAVDLGEPDVVMRAARAFASDRSSYWDRGVVSVSSAVGFVAEINMASEVATRPM